MRALSITCLGIGAIICLPIPALAAPAATGGPATAIVSGTIDVGKSKTACADIMVAATDGTTVVARKRAIDDPEKTGRCAYTLVVPAETRVEVSAGIAERTQTELVLPAQLACNGHPKTQPKAKLLCNEQPASKIACNGMVKRAPVVKATMSLKPGEERDLILQLNLPR